MDEKKYVGNAGLLLYFFLFFANHSSSKIAFPAVSGRNYLTVICSFSILTKPTKPHSTFKSSTKSLSENNRYKFLSVHSFQE